MINFLRKLKIKIVEVLNDYLYKNSKTYLNKHD